MLEIWSSILGFLNISSASRIETEECVKPAAFIIIPSQFLIES